MCLLIVAWKVDETFPLIIGANRDERYDRPTTTFTALSSGHPRVLGGRDELAGGTWLAVSDRGIVAGLTNLFSVAGPDPTKRTRGELPLRLVQYSSASKGVADLSRRYSSSAYNGAAMFVGDRDFLFYIELGTNQDFTVLQMDPGIYVLENVPLNATSAKVDFVKTLLSSKMASGRSLWSVLPSVLSSHELPASTIMDGASDLLRPINAPCVHSSGRGTRSSSLIRVPANRSSPTEVSIADGAPCSAEYVDVSNRWAV